MFGEQLQKLRIAEGISQTELSQKLGVSKQSVSNWEHNNILPSIEILIKIANHFSCSTDYLLGIDDTSRSIDVSGLNEKQIAIINEIIREFGVLK